MRKLALILTIFAVAALSVGISVYYGLVRPGRRLDAESRQYADQAIKAIVAEWNPKELRDRASPEFLQVTSAKQIDELFDIYRQLGHMTAYKNLNGEAMMLFNPKTGPSVTANYEANADFGQNKVQIAIRLIQRRNDWQVLAFKINSPMFIGFLNKKNAPAPSPATP